MKRRTFLAQSGMAAGGLLLANTSNAFENTANKKAIGLQLYTVRDEISKGVAPLLANIAALGYTHIETYGYQNRQYFGQSVKDFKALLTQIGLKTPSAHIYNEDFLVKKADDIWKYAAEDAVTMGQKYIILPWLSEELRKAPDWQPRLLERINTAATISKAAGLQFVYHNHAFEFDKLADGTTLYDLILRQTDPQLVQLEMDIFWVVFAGYNPIEIMQKNPGRFPLWHVKDLDAATRKNADIGSGTIDFKEIFRHKKTSGLDYFFVEQENYAVSPLESIKNSIAYVKKALV